MIENDFVVIGAGGCGSWIVPALIRLTRGMVIIYDADVLETHNLDRQLFGLDSIGMHKAEALASMFHKSRVIAKNEWFHEGTNVSPRSVIVSCADNHPARLAAIRVADQNGNHLFNLGNEYTDAEAWYYKSSLMRDTHNDPRVFAPELMTSHAGDPMAREIGCTGAAQEENRQLVIANISAVDHALRLIWWWLVKALNEDKKNLHRWPVAHHNSAMRCWTIHFGDREKE